MGERRRVKSRNIYKDPWTKTMGGELNVGGGGRQGKGE